MVESIERTLREVRKEIEPRQITLDAREELAGIRDLKAFVLSDHSSSGPRQMQTCFAQVPTRPAEPEAPVVRRRYGASERVSARRALVVEALAAEADYVAAGYLVRQLGERYRVNCPSRKVQDTMGQDLKWLRENGHAENTGRGGGTRWRLKAGIRRRAQG